MRIRSTREFPSTLLVLQLPSSGWRDGIEAGVPARVSRSPRGPEPFLVGHPVQGGIERPFLNAQRVVRRLVNPPSDPIAVQWSRTGQRFQNQEVQRALKKVGRFAHRQRIIPKSITNEHLNYLQLDQYGRGPVVPFH